ncbi:MAG: GAF domain-containing protein, partial [Candidatus Dormibacteria bacterium]
MAQVHRRVRELEAAYGAAGLLLNSMDPAEASLTIVRLLAEALHAPRARFYRWQGRQAVLTAVCSEGSASSVNGQAPRRDRLTPPSASRAALASFVDERSGNLVVPLHAGGVAMGVVIIERSSAHRFEHDDIGLVDRIGALAGGALRNA